MMRTLLSLGVVAGVLACATGKESAKGDSLAAIDTLKPATETLPSRDSVGVRTKTDAMSSTGTKTKRDSIIGHDSVIPFDPTKKRLDTVRKKP